MKILAIDTSNLVMGIAVTDGSKVIGEVITNLKKNHSVRVMPAISELLQECGVLPNELNKIVVAKGPGSYTGVRIGVTIAKTLAWSLNLPLVGISSLEIIAANGRYFRGLISPIFDARRGQVYTGLYTSKQGEVVCEKQDRILLLTEWVEQLKETQSDVLFLGNDLEIHKDTITTKMGRQAIFAPFTAYNPRPSELAMIGMNKEPENVHTFVPNYIRMAEAEANWIALNQK